MNENKAYLVKVECTNYVKDNCCNRTDEDNPQYYDCIGGYLYVVTDDPKKIYDKFGLGTVLEIKEMGIGYTL